MRSADSGRGANPGARPTTDRGPTDCCAGSARSHRNPPHRSTGSARGHRAATHCRSGGPAAAAPECIEIGSSIPLTGKFGSLGSQVKPGYAYAVADINAAGGIYVKEFDKKIPLCLTVYDDESDPTKAVSKLETVFADQNVVAYLGGAGSDMHAATAAIAEKNKVPYCGVAFALWQIHQKGYKYLFSPFVKSPDQGKDVYEYLNAQIPEGERPTKVAIFQEKTDWGIELGGSVEGKCTQVRLRGGGLRGVRPGDQGLLRDDPEGQGGGCGIALRYADPAGWRGDVQADE